MFVVFGELLQSSEIAFFLRFTIVICVLIVSGMIIIFAFFKAFEVRRSFSAFVEDIGYIGACI